MNIFTDQQEWDHFTHQTTLQRNFIGNFSIILFLLQLRIQPPAELTGFYLAFFLQPCCLEGNSKIPRRIINQLHLQRGQSL
ncbi:hypothetical protein D3C81_1880990 [compost metagenome]